MIDSIDIARCILLAESDDSANSIIEAEMNAPLTLSPSKVFKRFLMDVIYQIERWDKITACIIFNDSLKEFVLDSLKNDIQKMGNDIEIWKVKLYFVDNILPNQVLALSDDIICDTQDIVLGKLDGSLIKRVWNLKSFW